MWLGISSQARFLQSVGTARMAMQRPDLHRSQVTLFSEMLTLEWKFPIFACITRERQISMSTEEPQGKTCRGHSEKPPQRSASVPGLNTKCQVTHFCDTSGQSPGYLRDKCWICAFPLSVGRPLGHREALRGWFPALRGERPRSEHACGGQGERATPHLELARALAEGRKRKLECFPFRSITCCEENDHFASLLPPLWTRLGVSSQARSLHSAATRAPRRAKVQLAARHQPAGCFWSIPPVLPRTGAKKLWLLNQA